jgi:hypothetical protein
MATLLMLFGVIRDLAEDPQAKKDCQECIYQQTSQYRKIPERTRLVFAIREEIQQFINKFIKADGGTQCESDIAKLAERDDSLSVRNMAKAVLELRRFFRENQD